MKWNKTIAMLITAGMIFSLAGCGGSSGDAKDSAGDTKTSDASGDSTSAASAGDSTAGTSAEDSTAGTSAEDATAVETDAKTGTIEEDVDYQAGKKYHFVFLTDDDQLLQQQMLEAYKNLQDKYNFEVEYVPSDADDDKFVSNLQTLSDRGDVDGLILETNSYMGDVCLPMLEASGIPWVNQFTEFYDADGKVATPTCIIPQWQSGYDSLKWICDNYKEYWGDVDKTEIGLINLDFSTSTALHDRTVGINDCFKEFIGEDNIYEIDTYALGEDHWMSMQGGYDPVSTTVSAHPEVKYWMVSSCLEYYAQGAARAAEDLKLNDNMLISCVGSPMFIEECEAGYEGAWKCCVCINNYAYATPIVLGLRAICDGRATEKSLWPDKHNYFSDTDAYGTWLADYAVVTKDTYKDYLAKVEAEFGP